MPDTINWTPLNFYGGMKYMVLKTFLRGQKVEVSYDRHIVSSNMECSSSDCCILTGTVEDVDDNNGFILLSYFSTENVQVLEKGVLTSKYVMKTKEIKKSKLINTRYIIDITILD